MAVSGGAEAWPVRRISDGGRRPPFSSPELSSYRCVVREECLARIDDQLAVGKSQVSCHLQITGLHKACLEDVLRQAPETHSAANVSQKT